MSKRRALTVLAVAAVLFGTLFAGTAPAQAATNSYQICDFPEQSDVTALSDMSKADAEKSIVPRFVTCLEVVFVDKCDGTTLVTLINWAKFDALWTRVTVELLDKDYLVKGLGEENAVTIEVKDAKELQPKLVLIGSHDGTSWRIEKDFGKPWTWEKPKACVDPSPSVTPSPVPSVSVTTSGPAAPAPRGNDDLPVTGASLTTPLIGGGVLVVVSAGLFILLFLKRRRETAAVENAE